MGKFLRFMTTNEELIDLGGRMQSEKRLREEEEEEEARKKKEEEEAEDSPPRHGYAAKLRNIDGRRRGTSATPMRKMQPQETSTPNTQKRRTRKPEERREEVEEVIIQDGAKVGKEPDAHTEALAEVGCYSNRENKTLMEDIDAVKERVARDRKERERIEKEREES